MRARERAEKMGWDERKLIQHNVRGRVHVKEIYGTEPGRQGEGGIASVSLGGNEARILKGESNDHQRRFLFLCHHCP